MLILSLFHFTTLIDSKFSERKNKIASLFQNIIAKLAKNKATNTETAQDAQIKREFEAQYESFLKLSQNPELENQMIKNGSIETHIVKGDFGYIVSTAFDAKEQLNCFYSHSYEGFTTMDVDGVEQNVYVNIKEDAFDRYCFGPRDDFFTPEEYIFNGFMRTAKGEFKSICCYHDKNINGKVDPRTVKKLYTNILTEYKTICVNSASQTK